MISYKSGWYEKDEFGLPFGKPSDANPNARFLFRTDDFSGLVARWYDGGHLKYYVVLEGSPSATLGVLGVKEAETGKK